MRRRGKGAPPLTGRVAVPGDKSISHRAVVMAALAQGRSRLSGINTGADVGATIDAVRALGADAHRDEGTDEVEVEGCGWDHLAEPRDVIDAGNSGTTIRTLLGVCATVPGLTVLTGDETVRRRPMLRIVAPLRAMGATVDGRDHGEHAPLAIHGGPLEGIAVDLPVASAQVKTALLWAGLRADGSTTVSEPHRSRDHTERMLSALGAPVELAGDAVTVRPGWRPSPIEFRVPGDISSAAFLVAAAVLVPGSKLTIDGLGLNPTRTGLLEVLARMGADLAPRASEDRLGEPVGSVEIAASPLAATEVADEEVPRLIDEVPALAVIATQAEGDTVIRGAAELRVKESDRIAALATGLNAIGGRVEALPDGLIVRGPTELHGGEIDSGGDHRIALAFAVAGLIASERVRVKGWSAVETSFPEFLDVLGRAQGKP